MDPLMLGTHSPIQQHYTIGRLLEISNVTFLCNEDNTNSNICVAFNVKCNGIKGNWCTIFV